MPTKNYTYLELINLGSQSTKTPTHIHLNRWLETGIKTGEKQVIPIWRDNSVQWIKYEETTQKERTNWHYMCLGMLEAARITEDSVQKMKFYVNNGSLKPLAVSYGLLPWVKEKENSLNNNVAQRWGVPSDMKIASKAALFYILYTRYLRKDASATHELEYMLDSLCPIIARYLDMAVGGEVRYAAVKEVLSVNTGAVPKDILEEAFAAGVSFKGTKGAERGYYDLFINGYGVIRKRLENVYTKNPGRESAWAEWYDIRQAYGIPALDWAIITHFATGGTSYSGPLWANAGILVRRYLKQEISNIYFLDQAFSTQHNGAPIFNKLWDIHNLMDVLNIAFKGEVEALPQYVTDSEDKEVLRRAGGVSIIDRKPAKGVDISYKVRERKALNVAKPSAVLELTAKTDLELIN